MKIIYLIIFVLLVGCKSIAPLELENADVNSGEVSAVLHSVNLNDAEKLQITHSINKFQAFVDKWNGYSWIESPEKLDFFLEDFEGITKDYGAVREIVKSHWAEFSTDEQKSLLEYQLDAADYLAISKQLTKNQNWMSAIKRSKEFVILAIGLAQAMKP